MVYLNEKVFVNIKSLELNILKIVEDKVQNELYYVDNITDEKKERIKNNILKEVKIEIKRDLFLYRIMADDRCTYKHRHGKNEGYFCHNNITKNGDHKKYLCRTHNRNHIPKKKEKHNISNKNMSISKSIKLIDINKNKILSSWSKNNFENNYSKKVKSLNNNINNSIFRKKFNFYKYYYILNKNYNEKVKENGNHLILDSKKDERTILYNYHNNIKTLSSIGKHNPIDVF